MKTPAQRLEKDIAKMTKALKHFAPGEIREAMELAIQNAAQVQANFLEIERLTTNTDPLN